MANIESEVEVKGLSKVLAGNNDSDNDGMSLKCASIPSKASIKEMFREIEEVCFNANILRTEAFLHRARRKIDAEKVKRNGSTS